MKNKKVLLRLFIILTILLLGFIIYKLVILNKYKSEYISIDVNKIFNETLNVLDTIEVDKNEILKFEDLCIRNYFVGYKEVENNSQIKAKYDKYGEVESFYIISSSKQYTQILNFDSFKLYSDDINDNYNIGTDKQTELYLKANKIENDIDYLKYIKDNYYIKNNIFTPTKTIKNNFLTNTFVQVVLPEFENITLINGRINGYIISLKNSNAKEIHILNNDIQYIITLSGEGINNNEFIIELLKTININCS